MLVLFPASVCRMRPSRRRRAEELGSRHGLQQPHHGDRDAALLDKFGHAIEDVFTVGVKAENEAAHHLHAITTHISA